ncbi:MAG TPA: MerR family transcriptional regulator [Candidatus Limnocylindria bacterium]|nr:MerR family transcriptional regulator [Candidatus Limnocylindria bacterium]
MSDGLRIGQAAEAIGVSTSALRRWERQGLVRPHRTRAGYRLYSDTDLGRLRDVRRMRQERVNAPGIRRILRGDRRRPASMGEVDGARLRQLREDRALSLRGAASDARISPSHLSAIERGAANPSVAVLRALTRAYGTTLAALVGGEVVQRVVRRDARATLTLGEGVRIEQLAVGAVALEPQLFVLAPGASSDGEYTHDGEEFLYVLAGRITIWIGPDECHELGSGDALSFPSTLPHRWRNDASGETRLLWINTPPTF